MHLPRERVDDVLAGLVQPLAPVHLPKKPKLDVRPRAYPMPAPKAAQDSRAESVVANLVKQPGVLGAVLAQRDGYPLVARWHEPIDVETFAAMHAAALNAAELALGRKDRAAMGLMVDLGDRRVLSRAVGKDLFFVLAVEQASEWESAFLWMEAAGLDVED